MVSDGASLIGLSAVVVLLLSPSVLRSVGALVFGNGSIKRSLPQLSSSPAWLGPRFYHDSLHLT